MWFIFSSSPFISFQRSTKFITFLLWFSFDCACVRMRLTYRWCVHLFTFSFSYCFSSFSFSQSNWIIIVFIYCRFYQFFLLFRQMSHVNRMRIFQRNWHEFILIYFAVQQRNCNFVDNKQNVPRERSANIIRCPNYGLWYLIVREGWTESFSFSLTTFDPFLTNLKFL